MHKQLELDVSISEDTTISTKVSIPAESVTRSAVLFLHFWGGSSRTWHQVLRSLADDVLCIVPSLRGWGGSRGPNDGKAYTVKDYASDVVTLLEKIPKQPECQDILARGLIVVGHSMGGKIAQYLVASGAFGTLSVSVRGLLLLAPAPLSEIQLPTAEMREQQRNAYKARDSAEFVIRNVLLGKPTNASDDEIKELVNNATKANTYAQEAWPLHGMGEDYSQLLTDRKPWSGIKVVVMVGENDRIEPRERVQSEVTKRLESVVDSVSSIELRLLGGDCGHLVPVERPQDVSMAIKEMLS